MEKVDPYEDLGGFSSYSGVQKKRRAIVDKSTNETKAVDNFDRGAFEVMKTQRWIREHAAPVLTDERRAEIAEGLRALKAKILNAKVGT